MSMKFYEYRKWAWDQEISPASRKFVLICLSEFSDEKGSCFPKIETISNMVSQGVSTVRAHLKELEREDFIRRIRLRHTDGSLAQYRYFLQCQVSAVGVEPSAEKDISLAPDMDNPYRRDLADNNNQLTTIEQPPNPHGGTKDIFEKLWKKVIEITPVDIRTRHKKKPALAKFEKIVTRKENSISASRVANAVLWFYASPEQTRDDGRYMPGLVPLLNSENFTHFLDKGVYNRAETKTEKALEAWQIRAEYVNNNDGEWPPSAPSPRTCPKETRDLVEKQYWEGLGWK